MDTVHVWTTERVSISIHSKHTTQQSNGYFLIQDKLCKYMMSFKGI